MNNDVEKIVELLQSYERLANNSDAAGLGDLYATDAILLPDRFGVFEGNDSIAGFYELAFSMLTLDLTFTIDPANIVVSGDMAYGTTNSTGTRFIKQAGETVPEINRELWVFNKVSGDWKIARYCFNKSE